MDKIEAVAIDAFVTGTINAFNMGMQIGRERVLGLLEESLGGHLNVCNYRAVTEKDCDVCFWAKTTLDLVNGETK